MQTAASRMRSRARPPMGAGFQMRKWKGFEVTVRRFQGPGWRIPERPDYRRRGQAVRNYHARRHPRRWRRVRKHTV